MECERASQSGKKHLLWQCSAGKLPENSPTGDRARHTSSDQHAKETRHGDGAFFSTFPPRQRAIVIGASIAGLLAARVLSERYPDMLLLERDPLPEQAAPRKGTPQAVHPHGLLARGLQVIEELFPGFTDTLVARGASPATSGLTWPWTPTAAVLRACRSVSQDWRQAD